MVTGASVGSDLDPKRSRNLQRKAKEAIRILRFNTSIQCRPGTVKHQLFSLRDLVLTEDLPGYAVIHALFDQLAADNRHSSSRGSSSAWKRPIGRKRSELFDE